MILRNFQYWPEFLVPYKRNLCIISKETAKRWRTTLRSCQGGQIFKCHHLGAVQKSILPWIEEFGRYGGREFITNPLSVTELNLTMYSIIFCKVSTLNRVKQRQKQPKKRFSLSTVEGSNDQDETVNEIGKY